MCNASSKEGWAGVVCLPRFAVRGNLTPLPTPLRYTTASTCCLIDLCVFMWVCVYVAEQGITIDCNVILKLVCSSVAPVSFSILAILIAWIFMARMLAKTRNGRGIFTTCQIHWLRCWFFWPLQIIQMVSMFFQSNSPCSLLVTNNKNRLRFQLQGNLYDCTFWRLLCLLSFLECRWDVLKLTPASGLIHRNKEVAFFASVFLCPSIIPFKEFLCEGRQTCKQEQMWGVWLWKEFCFCCCKNTNAAYRLNLDWFVIWCSRHVVNLWLAQGPVNQHSACSEGKEEVAFWLN